MLVGDLEGNESVLSRLPLKGLERLGAEEEVEDAVDMDRRRDGDGLSTGGMDSPDDVYDDA